jgi:hypothetical protein
MISSFFIPSFPLSTSFHPSTSASSIRAQVLLDCMPKWHSDLCQPRCGMDRILHSSSSNLCRLHHIKSCPVLLSKRPQLLSTTISFRLQPRCALRLKFTCILSAWAPLAVSVAANGGLAKQVIEVAILSRELSAACENVVSLRTVG